MAELEKTAALTMRVLDTNDKQLRRLIDAELLRGRIAELEGMLDDAIDERDVARAEAMKWKAELQQVAQFKGLR